jgi:REP element-mobilizing transposase RayT
MPKPRATQISLEDTPYYHCVSRCVRRAFLCGEDHQTGRYFEHRRDWIEQRLFALAASFAIDLCAYAVMSNHTHVVLHVDIEQASGWSLHEIVERWHGLFAGTLISQRFLRGDTLSDAEREYMRSLGEQWRERLTSVSWFMRCLNEHIARLANAEDGCTGRFWEGRFKSQALLDESALAACMAYVDLNPIRAGMAETPEQSDHTSIQQRLLAACKVSSDTSDIIQPAQLMPFVGNPRRKMPKGLAFRLQDYLELVDWTGRQLRDGKRGVIPSDLPPLLQRLHIEPEAWLKLSRQFEGDFKTWVGSPSQVEQVCRKHGLCWAQGISSCRSAFSP